MKPLPWLVQSTLVTLHVPVGYMLGVPGSEQSADTCVTKLTSVTVQLARMLKKPGMYMLMILDGVLLLAGHFCQDSSCHARWAVYSPHQKSPTDGEIGVHGINFAHETYEY